MGFQTVSVQPGYSLTIVTDAYSSGTYVRIDTTSTPVALTASANVTIGPFNEVRMYRVDTNGTPATLTLTYTGINTAADDAALALKADKASPTFTGTVVLPATTSIGTVSNTELSYLDGVTSSIQTQLNNPDFVYLDSKTASSSASLAFTGIGNYSSIVFVLNNIVPGTDNTRLEIITSADGVTYDTGASDYGWVFVGKNTAGTDIDGNDDADDSINVGVSVGSDTGEELNGEIKLFNPSSTTRNKHFTGKVSVINSSGALCVQDMAGRRISTTAITAVKFQFVTGTIASGTIYMYGTSKT